MLTAEANVKTERPSQYLVQLCRHFNQEAGERPHPDVQAHIEWSETNGIANFGWGQCTMQANQDTLTLRAEANDEENLQRVQDLIAEHLERFGTRDQLKVTWQPG